MGQADRRRFGYMPEERGLYPGMLVGQQLEYLGRLHGLSAGDAATATATWLERLEIADRRDSKVEVLSHGNQQRVQLAAALCHNPDLLVLDEPAASPSRPSVRFTAFDEATMMNTAQITQTTLPSAKPGRS